MNAGSGRESEREKVRGRRRERLGKWGREGDVVERGGEGVGGKDWAKEGGRDGRCMPPINIPGYANGCRGVPATNFGCCLMLRR